MSRANDASPRSRQNGVDDTSVLYRAEVPIASIRAAAGRTVTPVVGAAVAESAATRTDDSRDNAA